MAKKHDLASLELLLRTIRQGQQMGMEAEDRALARKRAQLDMLSMREASKRQMAELKLREVETLSRVKLQEAQIGLQGKQTELQIAQTRVSNAEALSRVQMSVKGHQLAVFQALIDARHKLSQEDFQRQQIGLQRQANYMNALTVVSELEGRYATQEMEAYGRMHDAFGYVDGENGFRLYDTWKDIAKGFRNAVGNEGMTDQEVASKWVGMVGDVYDHLTDQAIATHNRENPNNPIQNLPPHQKQSLITHAIRMAMGGGRDGQRGILMTAIEGTLKPKTLRKVQLAAQQAGDVGTPEFAGAYYDELMKYVHDGGKDRIMDIDNSRQHKSAATDPLLHMTRGLGRVVSNVGPTMDRVLPMYNDARNVRDNLEQLAKGVVGTAMLDLDNVVAGLNNSLNRGGYDYGSTPSTTQSSRRTTGAGPTPGVMGAFEDIMGADSLDGAFDALNGGLNQITPPGQAPVQGPQPAPADTTQGRVGQASPIPGTVYTSPLGSSLELAEAEPIPVSPRPAQTSSQRLRSSYGPKGQRSIQ